MAKKQKEDEGMSLDDAFGDDEDVEYAESKPRKLVKKESPQVSTEQSVIKVKASKPVEKLKKGDKIKVDSVELEIDAHYVMQDYKTTKEMIIEAFDPKKDKDYQIRYFSGQIENSIEVYILEEIIYNKLDNVKKVEW